MNNVQGEVCVVPEHSHTSPSTTCLKLLSYRMSGVAVQDVHDESVSWL